MHPEWSGPDGADRVVVLTPATGGTAASADRPKHVKSTSTFNEPTPVGEFGDFDIHNASTDSDNAVTFLTLPGSANLPAESVAAACLRPDNIDVFAVGGNKDPLVGLDR